MTILLIIAGLFLVLSALFFFGPHLVVYGTSGLRDAFSRPEAQIVTVGLVAAFCVLLFAPAGPSSLISGDETVQVVHADIAGPAQG
ncbi:MAG: hypothetical protein WA989_07240 [Henriciella sp.]|uniref:hypothetical protein n=1 Tax=Henriciella sp. TaxID=1968823 RepID=UPI003C750671